LPQHWIRYDRSEIVAELTEARAAILALTNIPYQRMWAEKLQEMELKREVAGTSRIEGADFTDRELDEASSPSFNICSIGTIRSRSTICSMSSIATTARSKL
jgi:hypothetical protein